MAEGLNSTALVYNRGCELSIEKWEKDQAAAKRRLKTALENCEQFKKRIKARKMTPPGTRRPVGSPADFKPPAAQPQSTEKRDEGKVLGVIDMGPWLELAKLVAAPTPSVQEGTEPEYIDEMISMGLRGYRLAKRDVQRAKDEYFQLGRQLVTCKAGGYVNDTAREQSLGFDKLRKSRWKMLNKKQRTMQSRLQICFAKFPLNTSGTRIVRRVSMPLVI